MHWFVNLQTITYTNTIAVITYRSFTYTYLQETHILQSRCIVTHTYHYRDALEYIYVCRCIHIDTFFLFFFETEHYLQTYIFLMLSFCSNSNAFWDLPLCNCVLHMFCLTFLNVNPETEHDSQSYVCPI